MRLAIVIPCLNEARTIAQVVAEARQGIAACGSVVIDGDIAVADIAVADIIVADNGSTDGSQDLARAAGARVVDVPVRGYGAALHWGIVCSGADWVVFGDADMSYDFTLLPRFVAEIGRAPPPDLVLGTRLGGEILPRAMPWLNRHVGTPGLNAAIYVFFGFRTTDCNSGQRLVRTAFYRDLHMRCAGMEWASELLIKTAVRGGVYREVAGRLRPDQRGRPPHMRRWRDGWRHLKSIVMLAPNRAVLAPSALLAAGAMFALAATPLRDLAATGLCLAYFGVLMALGIKLILHVDRVRPSLLIATLLRARVAEFGIAAAAAFLVGGGVILASGEPAALRGTPGALLATAGAATLLAVLYFETVRTHLVSDLDGAWNDPQRRRQG